MIYLITSSATSFLVAPARCACPFDTVNHNVLLSKIVRSTLPEATCRWLSNYLRGRQSVTSCRGVKSQARIGSRMSQVLFSFYLPDMPRPTEPVKRICYADDISVWVSGVKIPELEHRINDYLTEMSCFLLVIDICTKVDSNPVNPRPKAGQYPPEDQDL